MHQRGLDEQHELPPQLLLRDTRTMGMRIKDFFKDPVNSAFLLGFFGILSFIFSAFTEIFTLIDIGVNLWFDRKW
jgi:intracellular multiplication protein IcmO